MKPIIKIKSTIPRMRTKGRAIIQNTDSFVHTPGVPIGILLALTYAENLIPTWTTVDTAIPNWAFNNSLNNPVWAK